MSPGRKIKNSNLHLKHVFRQASHSPGGQAIPLGKYSKVKSCKNMEIFLKFWSGLAKMAPGQGPSNRLIPNKKPISESFYNLQIRETDTDQPCQSRGWMDKWKIHRLPRHRLFADKFFWKSKISFVRNFSASEKMFCRCITKAALTYIWLSL